MFTIKERTIDKEKIARATRLMLEAIGEDPHREGLLDTPDRVARMYEEIFSGLREDPAKHFSVTFKEGHDELILLKDVDFFSTCEHHLVPFFGKAHIAYIPRHGKVVGLSKLARVIDAISRRPQLQERITSSIADTIMSHLSPHGVMVIIEAEHMCMSMRGVKRPGAVTTTSAVRGILMEDHAARAEVLSLLK